MRATFYARVRSVLPAFVLGLVVGAAAIAALGLDLGGNETTASDLPAVETPTPPSNGVTLTDAPGRPIAIGEPQYNRSARVATMRWEAPGGLPAAGLQYRVSCGPGEVASEGGAVTVPSAPVFRRDTALGDTDLGFVRAWLDPLDGSGAFTGYRLVPYFWDDVPRVIYAWVTCTAIPK